LLSILIYLEQSPERVNNLLFYFDRLILLDSFLYPAKSGETGVWGSPHIKHFARSAPHDI
jgi:hypothetical protein